MKTTGSLQILIGLCFGFHFLNAQNNPPVAINDTVHTVPGWDVFVNVLDNDFDPEGDSIYIANINTGSIVSDSVIYFPYSYSHLYDYYKEYSLTRYYVADTVPWYYSYDTGYIYVYFDNIYFYDSLNVNNVNAWFNCFGKHFLALHGAGGAKYFVPNGGTQTSLFSNAFWIGGIDESSNLHLAAGRDFFHGPISNAYDSIYEAEWFRIWKLTKEEIEYHKNRWWESGYEPIENIVSWPGNGDTELGQSENIAPYYDYNNDGIYDPMSGDHPIIKGDQALFFIFNDERKIHTQTGGIPLGIEIRAMAYAFNEPTDSALWNTTFLHYEIENKSDTTYNETSIGSFTDIDIGNAWDDYVGCNVQRGYYYGYNGDDFDDYTNPYGDSINNSYGYHPPAQAVMILGGPYMDEDGMDNPRYDENNQQLCDVSINGLNFGDTIVDNERFGMTGFMYTTSGPNYASDPQHTAEYYGFLRGYWKDYTRSLYGGNGHISSGASGPICNFIYPGDSDTCNWGTNGILPNGGYNQNGLYWTEEQVGNDPGDRRGLGSSGPFTFKPGDIHEIDFAFVWARDYDGVPWSSVELLKQRCIYIKEKFENDPDFFSGIKNYTKHSKQILIYPNPVYDELTIKLPKYTDQGYMIIFDILGTKLTEIEISNTHEMMINTNHFQNGLYIVKVFDGSLIYTSKFIKK